MILAKHETISVIFNTDDRIINEPKGLNKKKKNIKLDFKVLFLINSEDNLSIIITADIIWFSENLKNTIIDTLSNEFKINKCNIFLCASHTHGGLQTDINFKFGDYNEDFNQLIINTIFKISHKTNIQKGKKYVMKYGESKIAPITVNRRLYAVTLSRNEPFKRAQNRPNTKRIYPDKIKTISLYDAENIPKIILLIFPCHPLLDDGGQSGRDFPGLISDEINNHFNKTTSLFFLQGFCGDISPRFIYNPKNLKDFILEKLIGPKFLKPTNEKKQYFISELKKSILLSLENSKNISANNFTNFTIDFNTYYKDNSKTNRDLQISFLKFNDNFGIFFVNAEMLYQFDIENNDDLVSVGYTNGMIGYIAPKEDYKYLGYEINGFLKRFNLTQEFNSNTGDKYKAARRFFLNEKVNKNFFSKIWKSVNYKKWNITYAPNNYDFDQIKKFFDIYNDKNLDLAAEYINKLTGNFSVYASKDNQKVAFVDTIRSYPIYYDNKNNQISNDPQKLIKNNSKISFDQTSVLEFSMSSYVLNNRTLLKSIFQVRPGEIIELPVFKKKQYFIFYPKKLYHNNIDKLSRELENITNTIFIRLINKFKGKRLLVPLSGGFDSRLVLAKLVELGCDNLEAFTYGISNNGELIIANNVAKKLNVKWNFFPTNNFESNEIFNSKVRLDYWANASGFSVLPNMQEFHVLYNLNKKSLLTDNDVIINGQAGDFITGGHLTDNYKDSLLGKNDFIELIINKHFKLWSNLFTTNNKKEIEKSILSNVNYYLNNEKSLQKFDGYEAQLWEWSERQSKFVSNQQRIYEFFDINWYLPLWDREYLDFWINCPKELLLNQKLYKHYLDKWNYRDLFNDPNLKRAINPWIGASKIFIFMANIIKILKNNESKENFYRYVKYFNHYSNHYHSYEFKYFLKRAKFIRNHTSLNVESYVKENIPNQNFFDI